MADIFEISLIGGCFDLTNPSNAGEQETGCEHYDERACGLPRFAAQTEYASRGSRTRSER
jgi:hypothetical protein